MGVKTFRDLIVWQRGMEVARAVHRACQRMPHEELFGLTSQVRRAAYSIPMNIAEGFGKYSRPELIRGLGIAKGSLFELMTAYELAISMEMIEKDQATMDLFEEEDRLLSAFIRKLQAKG